MKTKYEVEITARDCADGVRNNEHLCVVSTAIGRLQPNANRIESNVNTIRFSLTDDDGKMYRLVYPTPPVVQDYIRYFDAGKNAKPMRFTLDKPQIVEKVPPPKGKAITPSFKAQGAPTKRRSIRVFGEKTFQHLSE